MSWLRRWLRSKILRMDELDGCALEFDDPEYNTADGEQTDTLLMFADVWDDPAAVTQRISVKASIPA